MLYSSHKWISISHNLNTKGYIRIVQNSVFIRKNPGEQMILVPRKLLLLHICDCNRLRAKIDGLSAHQVPWRLWKSRAWITYFTFWTSTGTNIKQKQKKRGKNKKEKKNQPIICARFTACSPWPYFSSVCGNAAEHLGLREHQPLPQMLSNNMRTAGFCFSADFLSDPQESI